MDNMLKGVVSLVGMIMIAGVLQMMLPQAAEPEPPTTFGCPYCEQSFNTMSELIDHINGEHPEMPPYEEVDMEWE